MSRAVLLLGSVAWLVLLGACSGNDNGDVITPPLVVSGEWRWTFTETSNTCHPRSGPDTIDELLTVDGSKVFEQDENDFCDPFLIGTLSGNTVSGSFTETEGDGVGCTVRYDSTLSATFATDTVTGTFAVNVTLVSGNCSDDWPVLPCGWQGTSAGARCQGCYEGCESAAR